RSCGRLSPLPLSRLCLHDALPISLRIFSAKTGGNSTQWPSPSTTGCLSFAWIWAGLRWPLPLMFFSSEGDAAFSEKDGPHLASEDRKSTRLNSSHGSISYAVFCVT